MGNQQSEASSRSDETGSQTPSAKSASSIIKQTSLNVKAGLEAIKISVTSPKRNKNKCEATSSANLESKKLGADDFDLLSVIGKGSFGKVMQVRKKDTGKIYAMKVLKKNALIERNQVMHTKTERKVLEKFEHPFLVNLRFAFQTDSKLYIVLDYFNGGELFFHLQKCGYFEESRAIFYAAEVVLAIEYLHQHNVIYRDL